MLKPNHRNPFWKLSFDTHRVGFELTRGRLFKRVYGMPVLMLRHRGAKSGKTTKTMAFYGVDGPNFAFIASKLGEPRNRDRRRAGSGLVRDGEWLSAVQRIPGAY